MISFRSREYNNNNVMSFDFVQNRPFKTPFSFRAKLSGLTCLGTSLCLKRKTRPMFIAAFKFMPRKSVMEYYCTIGFFTLTTRNIIISS